MVTLAIDLALTGETGIVIIDSNSNNILFYQILKNIWVNNNYVETKYNVEKMFKAIFYDSKYKNEIVCFALEISDYGDNRYNLLAGFVLATFLNYCPLSKNIKLFHANVWQKKIGVNKDTVGKSKELSLDFANKRSNIKIEDHNIADAYNMAYLFAEIEDRDISKNKVREIKKIKRQTTIENLRQKRREDKKRLLQTKIKLKCEYLLEKNKKLTAAQLRAYKIILEDIKKSKGGGVKNGTTK